MDVAQKEGQMYVLRVLIITISLTKISCYPGIKIEYPHTIHVIFAKETTFNIYMEGSCLQTTKELVGGSEDNVGPYNKRVNLEYLNTTHHYDPITVVF